MNAAAVREEGRAAGDVRFDWRVAVMLLVIAVALHVLAWVLLPFVLAAILAFICDPVVGSLARRTGMPRWLAGAGVWLLLFAAGSGMAVAAALSVSGEVSRLAQRGPNLFQDVLSQVLGPVGVQVFGVHVTADQLAHELRANIGAGLKLDATAKIASPLLAASVGVILFAALSFYMMLSGPRLARGALWLAPPSQRAAVRSLLPKMLSILRRFYVGVLIIVIFTAAAAWIGYGLLFHVPDAPLLALALGVLETVPAVGPLVSAVVVAVVALQLHNSTTLVMMVGYAVALRVVIDDVVAPPVLGRSVSVHPVVVMLAYALGAVLFGVTGLLLAVPAAACTRIWLEAAYGDTPKDFT